MLKRFENLVFMLRAPILVALAALTLVTGYFALQLRFDAGFVKQLPTDHPFIQTFYEYRDRLPSPNTIIVGVHPREGTIWTVDAMRKLNEVTEAVFYLPGVFRGSVQSLWTPNTRVLEVNEEGLLAYNVIEANVTPENLSEQKIARIRDNTLRGGHVGQLVAHDFTIGSIKASLVEIDPMTKKPLDYMDLASRLETEVRGRFEDDKYEIHII
ncbi:MAG: RND family transporter, partial [Pseudomonadota bacterium]